MKIQAGFQASQLSTVSSKQPQTTPKESTTLTRPSLNFLGALGTTIITIPKQSLPKDSTITIPTANSKLPKNIQLNRIPLDGVVRKSALTPEYQAELKRKEVNWSQLSNRTLLVSKEDLITLQNAQVQPFTLIELEAKFKCLPHYQDKRIAQNILSGLCHYGNMESLYKLAEQIHTRFPEHALLNDPLMPSLANNLMYLKAIPEEWFKTKDYTLAKNLKQGNVLLLDESVLHHLETDETFRQAIKNNPKIKLVYPSGWLNGLTVFNQSDYEKLDLTQLVSDYKAHQNKHPQLSSENQLDTFINAPIYAKLDALGVPQNRLTILYNPHDTKTTPTVRFQTEASLTSILKQLSTPQLKSADIETMLSKFSPGVGHYPRELLIQSLEVYSPRRLAKLAVDLHKRINAYASAKGIEATNIMYVVPASPESGTKSFGYTTQQFCKVNHISPQQIIGFNTDLPVKDFLPALYAKNQNLKGKKPLLVILDDFAGSGQSLETVMKQLRPSISSKVGYNGELVLAPLVSSTIAMDRFKTEHSRYTTTKFLPGESIEPFRYSDYYQTLPDDKKKKFSMIVNHTWGFIDRTAKDTGYSDGHGYSVVFPYMSPNNNNGLFNRFIAPLLTLKREGVKHVNYYKNF